MIKMEVMWIADPLLCAVIVQLMGICWAISLVRQLEFLLKKNNKMPIDKHLSIQFPRNYFFGLMVELKSNDSFIYLKEIGVLLEEECILDQPERVNGSVDSVSAPMMCNVVKIVNQELGERSLEKPDLFLDSAPRLSHSWIQMAGK
ncbi:hypothetical protein F2Q69_00063507 [Brassica cretica]|uniref:Uncharacterized protein n=1 Tax=Brassica cretica TaxID=69181 RepID=A0A8S9RP52_BRACR|nr:hypothetical protein F2Q69_00063507 [Brassica cretica]